MSRGDLYQMTLIGLGVAATSLLGYFFYQELFPEYKIYQDDYVALEEFRSTYTGQPPPAFQVGIKQIVLLRDDKGPPVIDRCVSCHVALQFEHFSPTKIGRDNEGNIQLDENGYPIKVSNNDYVWARLDAKILELKQQGNKGFVKDYEALKTAEVDGHVYDVTKVLQMHPLMGKETRPFEFHPIEEYGCVSCHNGNGRGLTTERAHGPVFDGNYAIEDTGFKPSFLEIDEKHDPAFSKVFNHKPGDELLFQTHPLYVGGLIQAKCIQCHQSSVAALMGDINIEHRQPITEKAGLSPEALREAQVKEEVDFLTYNYLRGQNLYISQACYACHKISGLARGGVGPELTREGFSYPWFVKESIVWPQADLKTSTMPNYRLDHRELEDLVTFLLAQTGENKAVSPILYKTAIQEWENGKKLPWEKPITPAQIQDLNFSMTVFATEGCAACHRLKGFTSDVGFAVEKENKEDFDSLYKEKQWFRNLIPETITGSEIAKVLEKHGEEIDKRIVNAIHDKGLLNEIEVKYPETIESYYSNFRFASRVHSEKEWEDRLHRVLMTYIQEYGLGRLVGPRPNWSGVYRTDQWLMEHFKNPSSHVPRSIMPVFPFDDTKFYALTHMLDVLGIRNRNGDREVWNHEGFNPAEAFQSHCAQCHGPTLEGNGPVAEWIYPVPKNLRNSDFLRQLTKERAIQSITHGVKGTPMPPWGEAAKDKPTYDGIPVFTAEEIKQIVDWIFSGIPGGHVLRGSEDIPKWKYSPEDILKDLYREGNYEKFKKSEDASIESIPPAQTLLLPLKKYGSCYAALNPVVAAAQTPAENDNEIFDVTAPPVPGVTQYGYYIKKKFYTPENLEAGRAFFELNCAVCHGKDADGSGLRAEIMQEAKPRMLTNFDWINTRDDLRLIQSIKYGVAGTAMTPWGDLTNSLQRLQLVMFIRTLSEEKKETREIDDPLYEVFDQGDQQIERMRLSEYTTLNEVQAELSQVEKQKQALYAQVEEGKEPSKEVLDVVQKELLLAVQLNRLKEKDEFYINLKNSLKKERELYRSLGLSLLQLHPGDRTLKDYGELIKSFSPRFQNEKGKIIDLVTEKNEENASEYNKKLIAWVDGQLAQFQKDLAAAEGKIDASENKELVTDLQNQISNMTKFRAKLLLTEKEGNRFRAQQRELINIYNAKNKS